MLQEPGQQDAESSAASLASVSVGTENPAASSFIIITIKKAMEIQVANSPAERAIEQLKLVMN